MADTIAKIAKQVIQERSQGGVYVENGEYARAFMARLSGHLMKDKPELSDLIWEALTGVKSAANVSGAQS